MLKIYLNLSTLLCPSTLELSVRYVALFRTYLWTYFQENSRIGWKVNPRIFEILCQKVTILESSISVLCYTCFLGCFVKLCRQAWLHLWDYNIWLVSSLHFYLYKIVSIDICCAAGYDEWAGWCVRDSICRHPGPAENWWRDRWGSLCGPYQRLQNCTLSVCFSMIIRTHVHHFTGKYAWLWKFLPTLCYVSA